jgi:hypothetical protein
MRSAFAILFLSAFAAIGATNTAASISWKDVTTAYSNCSRGDVLTIPAGSANWTNSLHVFGTRAVSVFGAGEGQSIITDTTGSGGDVFSLDHITNIFVRVSGFTVIGGSSSYDLFTVGDHTAGGGVDFARIDHITMTNVTQRGFNTAGHLSVLIDHCTIKNKANSTCVSVDGDDDGNSPYHPAAWSAVYTPGTTNGVVIEDCVFDRPDAEATMANGAIDTYASGIWTARHCIFTNGNVGSHGLDSSGSYRGPVGMEFYSNVLAGASGFSKTYYNFRGGTLISFWNTLYANNASDNGMIFIDYYRARGTNAYGGTTPCCNPWGPVSITNAWDGNTDAGGYPGLDQMGWGPPTTYGATNTVQTQMPLYAWSNTMIKAGVTSDVSFFVIQNNETNIGAYSYISNTAWFYKTNRDFYNFTPKPSYSALVYPHPLQGIAAASTVAPSILGIRGGASFR